MPSSGVVRPVVFSGPSGAGKSTLLKKLMTEYPSAFGFTVSHTTRNPRPGECNGKDYHFTDLETMKAEVEAGKFIESATFSGNMYGTSKAAVNDVLCDNRVCLLDIDEQGVKSIKDQGDLDPLYVFVSPPSLEALRERLKKRGTETAESLKKRMATAESAIAYSQTIGAYDVTIVNDELEVAYTELKTFLLKHFESVLVATGNNGVQQLNGHH